jgi:hypothetical protein
MMLKSRPQTKFITDAPDGKQITLKVPGIAVAYQKEFANFEVALPAVGEKQDVNREIDLSLQKMALESGELLWENGTCTADLAFAENETEINLRTGWPSFIVYGDWEMLIK